MGEGPVQQKALIGPEDTTRFTGGFDTSSAFDLTARHIGAGSKSNTTYPEYKAASSASKTTRSSDNDFHTTTCKSYAAQSESADFSGSR